MVLDTSFRIVLMDGEKDAVENARTVERELGHQRRSSMPRFELDHGLARAVEAEAERETVDRGLASKPLAPAEIAVRRKAGRGSERRQHDGTPVGDGDVLIGAIAEVVGEPLLTRTVGDGERLDVDIETD